LVGGERILQPGGDVTGVTVQPETR